MDTRGRRATMFSRSAVRPTVQSGQLLLYAIGCFTASQLPAAVPTSTRRRSLPPQSGVAARSERRTDSGAHQFIRACRCRPAVIGGALAALVCAIEQQPSVSDHLL